MKEVKCPDCGTTNPRFAVRCQFCKRELKETKVQTSNKGKENEVVSDGREKENGGEEVKEPPPYVVQFVLTCPNCNERSLTYNNTDRLFECGSCNSSYALVRMQ